MTTVDQHTDARRTRRLTTIVEYHDGSTQVVIDRTNQRDLFADFLRAYYDGEVEITDAPGKSLPFDPGTLDALGISVSEYAGTSFAIAQVLGDDPGYGAMVLDVVAATLAVAR